MDRFEVVGEAIARHFEVAHPSDDLPERHAGSDRRGSDRCHPFAVPLDDEVFAPVPDPIQDVFEALGQAGDGVGAKSAGIGENAARLAASAAPSA